VSISGPALRESLLRSRTRIPLHAWIRSPATSHLPSKGVHTPSDPGYACGLCSLHAFLAESSISPKIDWTSIPPSQLTISCRKHAQRMRMDQGLQALLADRTYPFSIPQYRPPTLRYKIFKFQRAKPFRRVSSGPIPSVGTGAPAGHLPRPWIRRRSQDNAVFVAGGVLPYFRLPPGPLVPLQVPPGTHHLPSFVGVLFADSRCVLSPQFGFSRSNTIPPSRALGVGPTSNVHRYQFVLMITAHGCTFRRFQATR